MTAPVRAALLAMLALVACSRNPATGQRQFNIISTQQAVSLGSEAEPEFLKSYGGELRDAEIVAYVRGLGHQLAKSSEMPKLPWEFHVVDSAEINAFALPGGKIFVSRGLLEELDSEAELAGVLGHEIGHVTAEHIGQQMSRRLAVLAAATAVGAVAAHRDEDWLRALGIGAQVGGAVYLLKFGRDQELQADALGVRYMTRVGYNPEGQEEVLKTLDRVAKHSTRPPEFLSTHPYPETRVREIDGLIDEDYREAQDYPFMKRRYRHTVLSRLDDMPPPRHGKAPEERALLPEPAHPAVGGY
jgi:predicted Zn-dependent protease